ncbi:MAG: hypothetical protein KBS57_04245 [Alistipes sp.]|nr:hypothetical protein [Candidatus Minthomonas equi]
MRIKRTLFSLIMIMSVQTISASVWKIVEPTNAPVAYHHAATEFQKYYAAVTGVNLEITASDDGKSDLVVIGPDFVNALTRAFVEKEALSRPVYGANSDSYSITSVSDGGRKYLFLAGGSGRATLYAVYDFFEREAGCQWFWDGDIIPQMDSIPMEGIDVLEVPRFQYRGIRYFAHRSLTRFQAEHWGFEQWDKEIDWVLKKRLNLMMLRIGTDDVFQKAFPDIVPYPSNNGTFPEAIDRSFSDRTTPWPLEFRGQIRKHVLQYARERELIQPEDVGTMTHWYSPTPKAFVDNVKPVCFGQSGGAYKDNPYAAIWDIRIDSNMENYWKLTQAHIDHYGSPEMFHTIGLAERNVFNDRDKDVEMKMYAYRRIISKIREHYKNSPVLIAGWDFYYPGWTEEEIGRLLPQFDPANTIMFDYMSDLSVEGKRSNFTKWGVRNRFPYTFGIFHAYEWENELRGNYDLICQRIPLVVDDPMCCGFFFWPENSHSDQLMLEFFTHNAWKPDILSPEDAVKELCGKRYGEYSEVMEQAWLAALPLIQSANELLPEFRSLGSYAKGTLSVETLDRFRRVLDKSSSKTADANAVLKVIASLPFGKGNSFVDRDAIDLARTVLGRMFTVELYKYLIAYNGKASGNATASELRRAGAKALAALTGIRDVLSLSDDYSMNVSMDRLKEVNPDINPAFEHAFKGNAENGYCRTYISELFDWYYLPQMKVLLEKIGSPDAPDRMKAIVDDFYSRPLASMMTPAAKDFFKSIDKYIVTASK